MWCSEAGRRRHPHLENFLVRKLNDEDCCSCAPFSASTNYEHCVVSGVDPSHGIGPMPYFGYLVLTKEQLLVVRWPAKGVGTLIQLKNVTNIVAVAGESPIFLFSPYKEKAQQVRILYHEDHVGTTLENASKAIDFYLLDPRIVFVKYLRKIWIQRLINFTLIPNDVIVSHNNFVGLRYYEWLLQSISRPSAANPEKVLVNLSRISVWTKRDAAFRKSWWEDMTVCDWLFDQLRAFGDTNETAVAAILDCLVVVFENADSVIDFTVLELRIEALVHAVVRLSTNDGMQHISTCIDILYSILWASMPQTHSNSPTRAIVQALTETPNWQNLLKQVLDFSYTIFKLEHRLFRSEEIVFLLKTFYVLNRITEERFGTDMMQYIRDHYCEDFRYYAIVDQLSAKFPELCKLRTLVIPLVHKLKHALLCESKCSCSKQLD